MVPAVLPGAPLNPVLSQDDFICSLDVCTLEPFALDLPFSFCTNTYFVYFYIFVFKSYVLILCFCVF